MINSGTQIKTALVSLLKPLIAPVKVWSMMPPDAVLKYVLIQDLSETALDEKRAFLNEGFISIAVVEKFLGRDGDFDQVNNIANTIIQAVTPDRLSTFGNVGGINIFSLRFESNSETMFETDSGRIAVKNLRLKYFVQST